MENEFNEWMKEVDAKLVEQIGFTSEDCRDRCWYDLYDSGLSPAEAIEEEFCGNGDDMESMMLEELFG